MAEPQIELWLPKGKSHGLVSASLHKLAADVELATPERGMALLKALAG